MRPPLASFTSLLVIRQGRERKATEAVFCLYAKKPLHTGVCRGCHYLISHSVRLSVCLSVCVTFVVFTDCESCTRPISTTPASMKAGEYGLTRGTCLVVCRLELDAVAGLLWISWCVLGGADLFSVFFFSIFFSSNAHGLLQVCGHLASFTSLLVSIYIYIIHTYLRGLRGARKKVGHHTLLSVRIVFSQPYPNLNPITPRSP